MPRRTKPVLETDLRKRMALLSEALLIADVRAVDAYDTPYLSRRAPQAKRLGHIASMVRDLRIALADEATRTYGTDLAGEARANRNSDMTSVGWKESN